MQLVLGDDRCEEVDRRAGLIALLAVLFQVRRDRDDLAAHSDDRRLGHVEIPRAVCIPCSGDPAELLLEVPGEDLPREFAILVEDDRSQNVPISGLEPRDLLAQQQTRITAIGRKASNLAREIPRMVTTPSRPTRLTLPR